MLDVSNPRPPAGAGRHMPGPHCTGWADPGVALYFSQQSAAEQRTSVQWAHWAEQPVLADTQYTVSLQWTQSEGQWQTELEFDNNQHQRLDTPASECDVAWEEKWNSNKQRPAQQPLNLQNFYLPHRPQAVTEGNNYLWRRRKS